LKAGDGPLGDEVGDGAREVEGGKGVETLYAATGLADAGDPGAIAGEVFGVDPIHLFGANLTLRGAYPA
jgi:hypothetical protein